MASVVVDENNEYVWQVDDMVLAPVMDFVMRKVDSTSAFHDLLYTAKTYGKLEFFRLGEAQREQFERLTNEYYAERDAAVPADHEARSDIKKVKQLIDLIGFAKTL